MSVERNTLVASMRESVAKAESLMQQYNGQDMPEDIANQVSSLLGQSDVLRTRIANLDRLSESQGWLDESKGSAAIHHGWRNTSPNEGSLEVDPKSWREVTVVKAGLLERTIRYHVPLAVQAKDYEPAFMRYLQKGYDRLTSGEQKTLTEGLDSAGGFTVPPEFQARLIKKVATMATFRQYARVVTTSKDRIQWPKINYTTDDNYTSGVRLTWTGESPSSSTVHRVTEPVFGLVDIPVHTAMASLPLSLDLIEDSAFDIEALATDLLGEAFALGENNAFWNGTGAGQPLGIVTNAEAADGVVSIPSEDAATLTADGLIKLIYALPAQYENGARIFWNKATELIVRLLKNTTTDEYVWPVEERVGGFGKPEPTILGFPITRDEFIPDVAASAYPIFFGQLTGYYVVDRVGLSVQRLAERYAEQNMVVLLARKRVGGQVVEAWRLKAQDIAAS